MLQTLFEEDKQTGSKQQREANLKILVPLEKEEKNKLQLGEKEKNFLCEEYPAWRQKKDFKENL